MKRCEVCEENPARYRCPRCELETCCLACVNQHKSSRGCNGQRYKTAYVQPSEFNNRHLLSDYRFLEEVARKNNNAGRDVLKRRNNKPNFLQVLEKQARNRQIDLRFMPYPMTRRKQNSTSYQHRLKKMFWQIEWVFPEVGLTFTDKRICEDDSLESVLDRHVGTDSDPLVKHKLKPYIAAGKDTWSLFMQQENTEVSKRYYKLDLTKPLVDNFRHKQIVEFPVVHVALPCSCSQYITDPTDEEDSVNNESSAAEQCSTKGTSDCNQDILEHEKSKVIENVT